MEKTTEASKYIDVNINMERDFNMSKEAGYYLDDEALKKVKKAKALDESLLGRHFDRKKVSESYDRIFGKTKKNTLCYDCGKICIQSTMSIENGKTVTRCHICFINSKKKSSIGD